MSNLTDTPEPNGTGLPAVVQALRDEKGWIRGELSRATTGLNPARPSEPAVSRQRIDQIEQGINIREFLSKDAIHALAVALGVPDSTIYIANAVTLGLSGVPSVPALFPAGEFAKLPQHEQMAIRTIIVALAQKYST